jgi:hypothetical protein
MLKTAMNLGYYAGRAPISDVKRVLHVNILQLSAITATRQHF